VNCRTTYGITVGTAAKLGTLTHVPIEPPEPTPTATVPAAVTRAPGSHAETGAAPRTDATLSQRIAAELRAAIQRGDYQPGHRLPSGRNLMRTYQVARQTVQNAFDLLRGEGLIITKQGAGAYVRTRPSVLRMARNRLDRSTPAIGGDGLITEARPIAEVGPVDAVRSTTEGSPTADARSATHSSPVAGAGPTAHGSPVGAARSTTDGSSAADARSATDGRPVANAGPTTHGSPVGAGRSITDCGPVGDARSATHSRPVAEAGPTTDGTSVGAARSTTESRSVGAGRSTTDGGPVGEARPTTEGGPAARARSATDRRSAAGDGSVAGDRLATAGLPVAANSPTARSQSASLAQNRPAAEDTPGAWSESTAQHTTRPSGGAPWRGASGESGGAGAAGGSGVQAEPAAGIAPAGTALGGVGTPMLPGARPAAHVTGTAGVGGGVARTELADAHSADALGLRPGEEVLVRERVLHADGAPVQLATSRLPKKLAARTGIDRPDIGCTDTDCPHTGCTDSGCTHTGCTDSESGGIYARLAEAGHALDHFVEYVSARPARPAEASSLELATGAPVLCITRIAFDRRGTAVELNDMVLSGDRYQLVYELPAD
jgi:DNA-binding GntR family transcriptional regulator